MIYELNNIGSKVSINAKGAELISYVYNGVEYMWNKEEYWSKTSPILFPFIGQLKDKKYIYDGKTYENILGHGFAKDKVFEVVSRKENEIVFKLTNDEESYLIYPFKFELFIKYELNGNSLKIEYLVKNIDDKTMYFSLGTHPGFILEDYEKARIIFEKEEIPKDYIVNMEDGLLYGEKEIFNFEENRIIPTKDSSFAGNTVIMKDLNSKYVILETPKRKIKIHFDGFKYLAFWRKHTAPYVCIENWAGVPDFSNSNNRLEDKVGIEKLDVNEEFKSSVKIEIGE